MLKNKTYGGHMPWKRRAGIFQLGCSTIVTLTIEGTKNIFNRIVQGWHRNVADPLRLRDWHNGQPRKTQKYRK